MKHLRWKITDRTRTRPINSCGCLIYDRTLLLRRHPHPGPTVRRTLERRVRRWRAVHGPDQEVVFAQRRPPGRLALSEFIAANDLAVVVASEPLPHTCYHFRVQGTSRYRTPAASARSRSTASIRCPTTTATPSSPNTAASVSALVRLRVRPARGRSAAAPAR